MSKFIGFNVTLGAICQGETKKSWNDIFDTQFKEESLSNCRKFCNCQKDCKGFTFNPKSEKRKCSWKADSPIEILTNEGIEKSGQSCVIKGNVLYKMDIHNTLQRYLHLIFFISLFKYINI